jgi:ubiquinone/menaquinone biosynthesis C-methylase UbiE
LKGNSSLDDRKQDDVVISNRKEIDRQSLEVESFYKKYSNVKYYSITRKSKDFIRQWLADQCSGKVALDYCCGTGGGAIEMASYGAFAYGIDISDERIRSAKDHAAKIGFEDKVKYSIMDAEKMDFSDDTFDVILCSGVLHHLDLENAYRELFRVLKPSGKIICNEPLVYNPIINIYRRLTPHLRTAWEIHHILTLRDINKAGTYFSNISIKYYHLISIFAVPFQKSIFGNVVLSILEIIDSIILRIPFLQMLAWQVIFVLSDPKKTTVSQSA